MHSILCYFFFFANIELILAQTCSSFENVLVELKDKTDYVYNKTVNGCIERIEFDNRTVVEAYIKNQKIPKLGRDSVRNMKHLKIVSFIGCDLEVVEPTSFRNVPALTDLEISSCNVKNFSTG